jgi:hypothetical protein
MGGEDGRIEEEGKGVLVRWVGGLVLMGDGVLERREKGEKRVKGHCGSRT